MIIDLRKNRKDGGAYGLVAFSEDMKTAIKVFSRSQELEQARNVYESEYTAYELAGKDKEASQLVPEFYGKPDIEKIIDEDGNDITHKYYTDLAFSMSYEEGLFVKFSQVNNDERNRVLKIFNSIGIRYLTDCSVLINNSGKVVKVIDFATQEFEVWA